MPLAILSAVVAGERQGAKVHKAIDSRRHFPHHAVMASSCNQKAYARLGMNGRCLAWGRMVRPNLLHGPIGNQMSGRSWAASSWYVQLQMSDDSRRGSRS